METQNVEMLANVIKAIRLEIAGTYEADDNSFAQDVIDDVVGAVQHWMKNNNVEDAWKLLRHSQMV